MTIDRRAFLRRAGLGSISVASLPALGALLSTPALASNENGFTFVTVSSAGMVGGVVHLIAISGNGRIEGSEVEGGGTFTHFNGATTPATLIAAGTWEARRLISFNKNFGAFGKIQAGIGDLAVRLRSETSPLVVDATMRVVCNIGPAGIQTGQPEGVTLTTPLFVFGPAAGLTVFTRSISAED